MPPVAEGDASWPAIPFQMFQLYDQAMVCHMQDDEVRLRDQKPEKRAAFKVLQGAGHQGMRVADLVAVLQAQPDFTNWDANATRYLRNVSTHLV